MTRSRPAPEDLRFQKFASVTIHHLREPARTISLNAEVLQQSSGELPAETRRSIETLQQSACQMQSLLEALSEFADVVSAPVRSRVPVPLDLIVEQTLSEFASDLRAAEAEVSVNTLPTVEGDSDRLQTVFRHLLRNAVRYRSRQPLKIEVSARAERREWLISVKDNGSGVEPQFREKIFDTYTRLHGRETQGVGLGLSLCQTIVRALDGRIWAEDGIDGGTAICFTLPRVD